MLFALMEAASNSFTSAVGSYGSQIDFHEILTSYLLRDDMKSVLLCHFI